MLDETDDASPLCYSVGDPTWVAASLVWNLAEVKVPPETKLLYEDWMPHYRATERTNDSWIGVWSIRFPLMDTSGPGNHSGVIPTFVRMVKFVSCSPLCLTSSGRYMHVPTRVEQRPWSSFYGVFTLTCRMPGCGEL